MKIKVIKEFRDKTTAEKIEDQKILNVGDIIECDDELAKSRIDLGLAEKVVSTKSKKED